MRQNVVVITPQTFKNLLIESHKFDVPDALSGYRD